MISFPTSTLISVLSILSLTHGNVETINPEYDIGTSQNSIGSETNTHIALHPKQMIEGFGATVAFDISRLLDNKHVDELSTILFKDLNLEMLRIRNCYMMDDDDDTASADFSYETEITDTRTVIQRGEKALGRDLDILITSWTAPSSLKTTSSPNGGTISYDPDNIMDYHYREYAKWWMDSLMHYNSVGINPEYLSIQNQPNNDDRNQPSMKLEPSQLKENAIAGYNMAIENVIQYMQTHDMGFIPKFIGPETVGFDNTVNGHDEVPLTAQVYIDNLIFSRTIYAWAHHLYEDNIATNPDALNDKMEHFATLNGQKPIFITEYHHTNSTTLTPWNRLWNYAKVVHNTLTVEGASAFFHKDLYGKGDDALVALPDDASYEISPEYYALKHYSGFINKDAVRVKASTETEGVFLSAYVDEEEGLLTIVVLNENADEVTLSVDFDDVSIMSGEVYRSTKKDMVCAKVGDYELNDDDTTLEMEGESVTTFHLKYESSYGVIYGDADAMAMGYGFMGDY